MPSGSRGWHEPDTSSLAPAPRVSAAMAEAHALHWRISVRRRWAWGTGLAAVAVIVGSQAAVRKSPPAHAGDVESRGAATPAPRRLYWSNGARAAALQQAVLWRQEIGTEPAVPGLANLLVCRFKPGALGGTTPKFECTTEDGQTVKVKYGGAELGEVAASRLMRAVGFAADDVRFVERVRCHGCPTFPFLTMKVLGLVNAGALYDRSVDYGQYSDISWAAVERKHPGTEIETEDGRGWAWYHWIACRRRLLTSTPCA